MISAGLTWFNGVILRLQVRGHASHDQWALCVAVTCLLRSAAEALLYLEQKAQMQSLEFDWELLVPSEGEFSWNLGRWHEDLEGPLQGISQVLSCGLNRLAIDFNIDGKTLLDLRLEDSSKNS